MYVRVVGTVKTFSNKRHLAATHIRAIEDKNEVHYHLLECQYVSLVMRKGKLVRFVTITHLFISRPAR